MSLTDAVKPLGEIETDPTDPSREYIPLPGGWEIQTKGRGSTYRLCDTKTGERHAILLNDISTTRDFVTRMAHEIHAATVAPVLPISDEMVERAVQGFALAIVRHMDNPDTDAEEMIGNPDLADAMRAALTAALKEPS